MISHKHKCIFIHIPICAGSSVEVALSGGDADNVEMEQDHRSLRAHAPFTLSSMRPRNVRHLASEVHHRALGPIDPVSRRSLTRQEFKAYFRFSFVRNPFTRAWSAYRNVLCDESHRSALKLPLTASFDEFLHTSVGRGLIRAQAEYLLDWDGEPGLDFVGHFESLERDWASVADRIGLDPSTLPPPLPSGAVEPNYSEVYSRWGRRLVEIHYADDLRRFGYGFPGLG